MLEKVATTTLQPPSTDKKRQKKRQIDISDNGVLIEGASGKSVVATRR